MFPAPVSPSHPLDIANNSPILSPASHVSMWSEGKPPRRRWRHTVGIILLLATVFLWTASNFLASTIFADNEYSKPYLVTYINTAFFILPLIPMLLKHLYDDRNRLSTYSLSNLNFRDLLQRRVGKYKLLRDHEASDDEYAKSKSGMERGGSPAAELLLGCEARESQEFGPPPEEEGLTLGETVRLSFEFCLLWFSANYFASSCLSYTTVASATILASTSPIWTLLCGTLLRVELFTLRKLLGVLASLIGIVIISGIDVSGTTDSDRGSFPAKTGPEMVIGDAMAFFSAVLYGFYGVFMKKRIGDESKVNMALFFGLVGVFNVILLWPGLVILHYTKIEPFELPPTARVVSIVLINSASSLVADFCWAFAMLLTSPLIVTVGLGLTIPLSLVGQMVIDGQYSSIWYWVGALVMLGSFWIVNHEDSKDEESGRRGSEGILNISDTHNRRGSSHGVSITGNV